MQFLSMVYIGLIQAAAVLLLSLSSNTGSVQAWGKQGHEIVGNVASMLLSARVRARVAHLLRDVSLPPDECDETCSPLAKVADWADQVRFRYHWSAALHYIDVRDDLISPLTPGCPATAETVNQTMQSCYFDYSRDCPDDACVAGAITNYTHRLLNQTTASASSSLQSVQNNQTENLMFLVHFIGDIHQPLHASRTTDRGGNSIHVKFESSISTTTGTSTATTTQAAMVRTSTGILPRRLRSLVSAHSGEEQQQQQHHSLNLHAVWDDSIIEATLEHDYHNSRNALEASLVTDIWQTSVSNPSLWNKWLDCANGSDIKCTTLWGQESFEYAIRYAYQNADGTEVVEGSLLRSAYYESRLPIVRERLAVAAIRLAVTLEQIFGV